MTWLTQAATRWGKRPIWLFEFMRGGVTTRLTSAPVDYVDDSSVTWTQTNLGHTRIRTTSTIDRAQVKLVFTRKSTFAQSWRADFSYEPNECLIYHEYRGESPTARQTKFRGRVVGIEENILTITLILEDDFTSLRGRGISTTLQRPCRHAVYTQTSDGYGCGVDINVHKVSATMTALSANSATITEAGSAADGTYSHGILIWNGKYQHIMNHAGTTCDLARGMDGLSDALISSGNSLSVEIAPGCNGTRAICASRFNNIDRHGGFPWAKDFIGDGRTLF